ncbi:MAG: methyltransferase domain-containing protein [Acidimicrobiia bacterium]
MQGPALAGRRAKVLEHIQLVGTVGLEVGALHNPVLTKAESDVRYVDHAATEDLRAKYADHPHVAEMVDVDVVWNGGQLVHAVGPQPVDYVIASHVIEHVPDLIGWLAQMADVLRPDGVLSLVIPDKRYCFDTRRATSAMPEIVDAWLTNAERPSVRAVYDFYANLVAVDALTIWAGAGDHPSQPMDHRLGLEWARKASGSQEYVDVHCWVFTPTSFLEVLEKLMELGLLRFRVLAAHDTEPGGDEFYVSLQRLPDGGTDAERREEQLASLPPRAASVTGPGSQADPAYGVPMLLSRREQLLVEAKRRAVARARRLLRRQR